MLRFISIFVLILLVEGSPSIELELSFKTTLDQYEMAYTSASFTISDDIIYVVNGANVGNAILKFDLAGSVVHSHWSRTIDARLSLVENFPSDACASSLMP